MKPVLVVRKFDDFSRILAENDFPVINCPTIETVEPENPEDLAAKFETSKRTIYRDVQALCETGVPVMSQAGVGYALVAGYFLPPHSWLL